MEITKWRGVAFSTISMYAGMPWDNARGQWSTSWNILPRGMASPIIAGGTLTERVITVDFQYTGTATTFEVAFDTLLGFLDPLNDEPGTLTAVRLDATEVEREAVIRFPFGFGFVESLNSLTVEFVSADPRWKATTATTVGPTAFTADGTLAVNNTGLATVPATFTITPTSNAGRVGDETALIGWKYRRPVVVTNDTDEDWHEVLWPFWWGDTTALTITKAQASGSDVRVWDAQGNVVRRQLQNWDTLATMVVFPVTIPAGESATYWVVYGNPAASTSATTDPEFLELDTRGGVRDGYAAPDLFATTVVPTGASTTTVITVSPDPGWEVGRLAGGWLWLVSGLGSSNSAIRRISANTSNTVTIDDALVTAPDATSLVAIWMSGIAMEGGRPDSATATVITDSSKVWQTDQWEHGYAVIETGTGAGQTREVLSNTGTTFTTAAWTTTPDTTSRFRLIKPGYQTYMVDRDVFDTDWRGLWRLSNYYESPKHRARYGDRCPGAWTPFARWINEDNYAQPSSNDYGSGGGHAQNWFPNGRIRRQVRQDRHYGEHKQADGVRLASPLGIDLVMFDYQWKNQGGICKFVVGAQTSDATDFMDLVTNSTTQASLTDVAAQSVNLTEYSNPITLVSFNVGPVDGVLIPNDTDFSSEAEWRTKDVMRVWVSPGLVGGRDATYGWHAVGAEEEAYDANMRLALNGRIVQLGGAGRHIMVPLNDELVIRTDPDTEEPWCAIEDAGVLSEWAGNAVRFLEEKTLIDGNLGEVTAEHLLALPPGSSDIVVSETAIGSLSVSAEWVRAWLG